MELQVLQVRLVQQGLREPQALQELLVQMELQATPELLAPQVQPVLPVPQVRMELQVLQVRLVQ